MTPTIPRPLHRTLVLAGLLCASVGALAHHAFAAEFDAEQPLSVSGTVTKLKLVNPHSWLYLDITAPDGTVTNWGFEFGAPFALQERGLARTDLPPGAVVSIRGFKSKNGKPYGYASTVTLKDGRSFAVGGAQDSPAQPAGAR